MKIFLNFLVGLSVIIGCCVDIAPAQTPTPIPVLSPPAALNVGLNFRRSMGGLRKNVIPGLWVANDMDTNLAASFSGDLLIPGAATARLAAETFFQQHGALFGITSNLGNLRFIGESPMQGGGPPTAIVSWHQIYQGFDVHGFGGTVSVDVVGAGNNFRIIDGSASIIPITQPTTIQFTQTAAQAIQAAINVLSPGPVTQPGASAKQVVFIAAGVPRATWVVDFTNPYIPWWIGVDGVTGVPYQAGRRDIVD